MKSLTVYFKELTEGYVQHSGNRMKVGSLELQFYPDHVFYVDGKLDLSIYKDGGFKPPRQNEIYVKDALAHGVPKDFVTIISTFLNTPRDKQEELMPRIVAALEHIVEKHLSKRATKEAQSSEDDAMRKPKITTEIDLEETEGLYNSINDRWSRRAKHQLSKNELQSAADVSDFAKGDPALYEGKEVEVRIPVGPNGTAGIMLEGHLKMVKRSSLSRLDENMGVMGGMKPLGPLNRIMQLAGLEHSGAVVETEVEEEQTIEEAGAAGTMFDQLYKANLNNPNYKNNPSAAKIATIGDVLAGLQAIIQELPADLPAEIAREVKMVPGIGANLIKTATAMTKPSPGTVE